MWESRLSPGLQFLHLYQVGARLCLSRCVSDPWQLLTVSIPGRERRRRSRDRGELRRGMGSYL